MNTKVTHDVPTREASDSRRDGRMTGTDFGLSAEEEGELGWAIVNDRCPNAMARLISSHSGLVGAIARRYASRGLATTALVTAGHAGLLNAVDHFDPAQGAHFSTGASWWIKHAIRQALARAALGSASPRTAPGRHPASPDGGCDQTVPGRVRTIPPRLPSSTCSSSSAS